MQLKQLAHTTHVDIVSVPQDRTYNTQYITNYTPIHTDSTTYQPKPTHWDQYTHH